MQPIIYLILAGIILFIAIPAALIFYARYWNGTKFLKAQMAKMPIDTFGGTLSKWKDFTFGDSEERYLPRLQGAFFDKILTAKGTMLVSIISSIMILLLPLLFIILTEGGHWIAWVVGILLFPLPVVIFYRSSYKKYRNIEGQREGQIRRMFEVANSVLKFDPMAAFMPSSVVNVTKWKDQVIPQSVIILYPTNFRADTPSARENFESVFNTAITEDNAWIYTWHPTKNAIQCRPVEDLPKYVEYKGAGPFEWHTFPLGVGLGPKGQEIISYSVNKGNKTNVYYPHVLVAGTTGSGKSVIQRNIIFHCIQHNDMWRFLGVDLKRVELSRFKRYTKTVLGIATDLEQGVEVVKYAHDVMMERYEKMEQAGVNIFLDMVDENGKPEYAILLMVDEAFMFMSPEGNKSEEGKRNDMLHAEASHILGNIARLGRAAGVHLVLATQRPDATVIKGELKNNLDVRIAAGRLDSTPSLMVLDSGAATLLPPIKGRGLVRIGADTRMFQGFFAEQDWIDNWLAKPQNRWREPDLFKDKESTSSVNADFEPIDLEDDFIDAEMEEFEDVELEALEPSDIDSLIEDEDELFEESEPQAPTQPTASIPLPPVVSSTAPVETVTASPTVEEEEIEHIEPVVEKPLNPVETIEEDEDLFNPDELAAEFERNFMFDDEIDELQDADISEEEIERLLMELSLIESEEEAQELEEDLPKVNTMLDTDTFIDDDEEEYEIEPDSLNEDEEPISEIVDDEDEFEEVSERVEVQPISPEKLDRIGSLIIDTDDEPITINKPVFHNGQPISTENLPTKTDRVLPSNQAQTSVITPSVAVTETKSIVPPRPKAPEPISNVLKKRPEFPAKKQEPAEE